MRVTSREIRYVLRPSIQENGICGRFEYALRMQRGAATNHKTWSFFSPLGKGKGKEETLSTVPK
jgi:hypothetical protein